MRRRKYNYYRSGRYKATTKERYSRPRKVLLRKQQMLHLDDEGANAGYKPRTV